MKPYCHLSDAERALIEREIGTGQSVRAIARLLGRATSSISRELLRNQESKGIYDAVKATGAYRRRRKSARKTCSFTTDEWLGRQILVMLERRES